jgi:tetratricopeptide (TPR) repeat protein
MKRAIFALAIAAACLACAPANARMSLAAGQCLSKFHSPAERVEYCKSYAQDGQADPDHYQAGEYALGWAYRLAGDFPNAETTMSDVIRLDPSWINAYMERSTAYAEEGKYAEALGDVEQIARMTNDEALPQMQRCWVRAVAGKDLELAAADCESAMGHYPADFAVQLARALTDYKRGDRKAAIAACDIAIASRPKGAGAYYMRGIAKGAGGANDIESAKDLDPYIDVEFAGYGVKP